MLEQMRSSLHEIEYALKKKPAGDKNAYARDLRDVLGMIDRDPIAHALAIKSKLESMLREITNE